MSDQSAQIISELIRKEFDNKDSAYNPDDLILCMYEINKTGEAEEMINDLFYIQ